MRLQIFLSREEGPEALTGLGELLEAALRHVPRIEVERVYTEDQPDVARRLGITSTPTAVIDGRRFGGIPNLEAALDALGAGKARPGRLDRLHGSAFLVHGERIRRTRQTVYEMIRAGTPGLVFAAGDAVALPADLAGKPVEQFLLRRPAGDRDIAPNDLERIIEVIGDFLVWHPSPVILVEGLDAIIEQAGFPGALRLVELLRDIARSQHAALFVGLGYGAADEEQLAELERLLVPV